MDKVELAKKAAGEAAAHRIQDHQRIGLGTGSTVHYFLDALGRRLRDKEIEGVSGVPTSVQTTRRAQELGIPLTSLDRHPSLDVTVDGADEVDPQWRLIKGLGGALLREKIVAHTSREFLIIVDEEKLVPRLCHRCPVPVEVLPFGWQVTARALRALGSEPKLRTVDREPFTSDQDNWILDCYFSVVDDPPGLAREMEAIPGVLGHGLFLNPVHAVVVGTHRGQVIAPTRKEV